MIQQIKTAILVPYYFPECKWGEAMFAEHLRDSLLKRPEVSEVRIFSYETLPLLDNYSPELVISLSAWKFRPKLKPNAKLIFWIFNFAVEYTTRYMSVSDAVLYNPDAYATNSPVLLERLQQYRPAILLHLAANPEKHRPVPPVEKYKNDLIYVGSYNIFTKSREYFDRYILPAVSFDLALYGEFWQSAPDAYRKHFKGLLPNDDLGKAYSSCKISLGFNAKNQTQWEMVNDRTFWAISSGIFFLSDEVPELDRILKGGLVTTSGYDDTVEKIRYYLNNESERQKIINRGMELIRKYHTYEHRAKELLKLYYSLI